MNNLYKIFWIQLKPKVMPYVNTFIYSISILNSLFALFIIISFVYAFGFHVSLEDAFIRPIFKISFFSFIIESLVMIIKSVITNQKIKHLYIKISYLILMFFIMIIWLLPKTIVEEYPLFSLINNNFTLIIIVGIEALIKFSTLITTSLSRRLSSNVIFIGSFIFLIILGTTLLLLPKATYQSITVLDSLFTSVSAVCVTGLTVVDVPTTFTTTGQIIIIILIQLGGIGIMTFTSFFGLMFADHFSSQNSLLIKDLVDPDKGVSQIFSTLRNIIFITFLIEFIGGYVIYRALGNYTFHGAYVAGFHAISAFCNAGFSIIPDGLYNIAVRDNYLMLNTISWLIILGGLGFPILFNLWQWFKTIIINQYRRILKHRRDYIQSPHVISSNTVIVLTITAILLISGTIIFFITEYQNILIGKTLWGKISTAFFLSTTPRTAGFNAFDMSALMPITITYMIFYMWVGASPMSTGGGIKTTTFGIALLNVWNTLRGRNNIEIRHRTLSHQTVNRAFIIIFVSLFVIAGGIFLMSAFEPHLSMQAIAFEIVSAFSTVGLSLNITPTLTIASKITLIIIMFIGRMGLLTLLSCFILPKEKRFYKYPSEHIPIN